MKYHTLVVAGGGGAGGGMVVEQVPEVVQVVLERKAANDSYTASPLDGGTPITVTATAFPIAVGGGGAANHQVASSPGPGKWS